MFNQQDSVANEIIERSVLMNEVIVEKIMEKTEPQVPVSSQQDSLAEMNVVNETVDNSVFMNDVLVAMKIEKPEFKPSVSKKLMIEKIEPISTNHKIAKRTYKKKK